MTAAVECSVCEAEHLIQAGLLALKEGMAVIAIAHRLSAIMHLDRIVVSGRTGVRWSRAPTGPCLAKMSGTRGFGSIKLVE